MIMGSVLLSHRACPPVRYWTKIPTTFLQAVGILFLTIPRPVR